MPYSRCSSIASAVFFIPLPPLSCWNLQVCDVSSLSSVAAFASDWLSSQRPLHLLVNNAGVLVSQKGCRQGSVA